MDVVVQPSVPWMNLNEQIKESGLFFPVDPGPSVSLILAAARQAQLRYPVYVSTLGQNRWHGGNKLQVCDHFGPFVEYDVFSNI